MSVKAKIIFVATIAAVLLAGEILRRVVMGHTCCICELHQIDGAKQTWALQYHKAPDDTPTWADLQPFVFPDPNQPLDFKCPKGGTYTIGCVGIAPTCSIGGREHTIP